MSELAIRVDNLGKAYRIGGQQAPYRTIRETLTDAFQAPFQRAGKLLRGQASGAANLDETLWALKDVSFSVQQGEVVGVIGRNGAGKSTLLKILSRITEPTAGRVEIHGRVGSLLEVGTGFHPELTGRENIYLNGAILGMTRNDIERQFDEIVAFAEVERFMDTPVKHYSSGMYLRLAFAVAAHLEPEILLVDEVLAVGDAAFQKKCLGKMGDVANQGRTVLLVSHNMAAVQSLCGRCLVLLDGRLGYEGDVREAVSRYLSDSERNAHLDLESRTIDRERQAAWFTRAYFQSEGGQAITVAVTGQSLNIVLHYASSRSLAHTSFAIGIYNVLGEKILHLDTLYSAPVLSAMTSTGAVVCHLPRLSLPPARYHCNISMHNGRERVDHVSNALTLDVQSGDYYGTGKLPPSDQNKVLVDHSWRIEEA